MEVELIPVHSLAEAGHTPPPTHAGTPCPPTHTLGLWRFAVYRPVSVKALRNRNRTPYRTEGTSRQSTHSWSHQSALTPNTCNSVGVGGGGEEKQLFL